LKIKVSKAISGVATYSTTKSLPKKYKQLLPNAKEIEEKLSIFFKDEEL